MILKGYTPTLALIMHMITFDQPFKNHVFDMTYENNDYTISDYVPQYFGITIG